MNHISMALGLFFLSNLAIAQTKGTWQQEVNYTLKVTLDDQSHMLRGSEEFVYTNNSPYQTLTTTGTGVNIGSSATDYNMKVEQSGQIDIKGEKADIRINGKSMNKWMEQVEQRLNILTPNPELEKEWDDLRRLGERYRKLEKKCQEKARMWDKLKAMPKPEIK